MQKNIIIGIDASSDISALLDDNIKQFYFGYISEAYLANYATQHSLNRRYRLSEQYHSLKKAYATITQVQESGGIIYLALNAFGSNDTMMAEAMSLYKLFAHKVDGIIVATVAMAVMLKNLGYEKIVISNLFGVYTPQSVGFLQKQFKPMKIILPRDISLENIALIVTAYPEQKFECFLYGDNCRYSESFCFVEHGYDSVGFGSLCSFASTHKKPIKTASVHFKHIAKDSTLSTEEKKAKLSKEAMSIASVLDSSIVYLYEKDFDNLFKNIELLNRYDSTMILADRTLELRTMDLLSKLEIPLAQTLAKKLKEAKKEERNSYQIFHKLNPSAISQTLAFFERFDNIVSYKIPSRGRTHYKHLQNLDKESVYNYQESQYPLWDYTSKQTVLRYSKTSPHCYQMPMQKQPTS